MDEQEKINLIDGEDASANSEMDRMAMELPEEAPVMEPETDNMEPEALPETTPDELGEEAAFSEPQEEEALSEPTVDTTAKVPGTVVIQKKYLVMAAVGVVFLLVASLLLGMYLSRRDGIDPNAKAYSFSANGASASGQMVLPGYSEVCFPANERTVGMILPNPDGNPCYLTFSLVLSDTGEVLYRSGLIPPGMAVTEIRLSRTLHVGNYRMRICIEPCSLDDRSPLNESIYEVDLQVK